MPNKVNYEKILGIGSLCLFLLGCSKESFLIQEAGSSAVVLEETVVLEEEKENTDSEKTAEAESAQAKVLDQSNEKESVQNYTKEAEIAIHICGAVNQPGVYYFKQGQRVYEGIVKAGGFREDADTDYLNQALFLEDGMKITVPTREETSNLKETEEETAQGQERSKDDIGDANSSQFIQKAKESLKQPEFIQRTEADLKEKNSNESGKVDLNTADEELLCTLPGIGQSRAQSIIAYREEHGLFTKTEDVMKVSGIKESAYEKIKDYITVSVFAQSN